MGTRARGFTLIEIMVSMTILAVGILVLSGLLLRSTRSAEASSAVSYQTAILAAELGRMDAIPFDQLAVGTVCDTATAGPLPRVRCITITSVSAKIRQVKVRVAPIGNALVPTDSVMFDRTMSGPAVPPLFTP